MPKDFFSQVAERRETAIAKLDAETFAPLIRNHLVQLYRAAHAVEPKLTGVLCAMGAAFPRGEYRAQSVSDPSEKVTDKASEWDDKSDWQPIQPGRATVCDFFRAVREYEAYLCNGLPYINDITPADLTTGRAKKAAIHGPRGLRSRLG
jgi:hypothetical protein